MNLLKKIEVLNMLADGSLSMLSLSTHKWMVHAYIDDTLLGNSSFYGETLEEALNKALGRVTNVNDTVCRSLD
jgi:hypothetical protein